MTDARFEQLAEIYRWAWDESRKLRKTEEASGVYTYNSAARDILTEWTEEKERAAGVTEEERDEYGMIIEGHAEAACTRWEDAQR